jgi:tetratricopeptide (TPR) repeat protein
MRFKHGVVPLAQAAGDLGVQYILEGSVRRDGAKVRIAAQLIQVKDETHLWAREYDRDLSDLLALQSEIARQTADELLLTLGSRGTAPQAAAARTPSPEAYNLYLKGLYSWNKRTHTDLRQAIQYFQRSVAVDPGYARAYVGLADGYSLIGGYSLTPQTEYMPKARAAALRALELDPTLAEAHTALALVVQNYDWDWQAAEKEFRRAIELNPNYATAHHWYAEHLMWRGRFDEALAESELARQLDPLSLIILADKAVLLYCARQYDRSIAQFRAVLELEPYFPRAHGVISPYVEKGMTAEALAEVEKSREHYGELPYIWAERAYIYARAGQTTQARRAVAVLEQFNRRQPVGPELMVWAYAGIGDKPRCMHWLEAAWKQHSNVMTALKVDPLFDGLRGDPRFQGLLHRVHLDQ